MFSPDLLRLPLDQLSLGTFVKTDSTQTVEVLGLCGLDYLVLDAEHAPFDRGQQDCMLLAARAAGVPMLVRIPDHADATILSVLDMGAAGIVVPHVDSAAQAASVVAAARFVGGRRGLSLSARFGGYGTIPRAKAIAQADACWVICQIESEAAVDEVEAIASTPGVGALMVGRTDLSMSIGVDSGKHPRVMDMVTRVLDVARSASLPVLMAVASADEIPEFAAMGAQSFIVGSDQSLLRSAACRIRQDAGDFPRHTHSVSSSASA